MWGWCVLLVLGWLFCGDCEWFGFECVVGVVIDVDWYVVFDCCVV